MVKTARSNMSQVNDFFKLNILWLTQLSALAEHNNLQTAAKCTGVSVRALRENLKACEGILGERLFIQADRHWQQTPAGALFLLKAQLFLAKVNTLDSLFQPSQNPDKHFKCGYSSTLGQSWLNQHIKALQQAFPEYTIEAQQGSESDLLTQMHSGYLQCLLTEETLQAHVLHTQHIADIPGVIVRSSQQPACQNWQEWGYIACGNTTLADVAIRFTTDNWFYALEICRQSHLALYVPQSILSQAIQKEGLCSISAPEQYTHPVFLSWKVSSEIVCWLLKQAREKEMA